MYKKMMITALTSICLMGAASALSESTPNIVQAATVKGKTQVKGNKARLYTSSGKKSKYYALANRTYPYSAKKYLKVGPKKYLAYKIGNNSQWLLSKNVKAVKEAAKKRYSAATIKMPSGYTRSSLLQAYKGKPSADFIKASIKGMEINDFSRLNAGETKADNKLINPANLTASQQKELTDFSLKIINSARKQLGLKNWVYSSGTQKLANSIAQEYQNNNRSIKDGDHYVAGIVRACQKNGLNLNDNYVEDMAGFASGKTTMTMGEMKRNVYFGIKQMIFGYAGSGENQRKNKSLYREWKHAGDLFNTQCSRHDGDYNYYGFSISKTGNIYSMHYISVPTFVVNSNVYNKNFKI